MIISEIYSQYKIMPSLQLHMLTVASVAKVICENFKEIDYINQNDIISACLLHDMGNIIKFGLGLFPDFLEPEGYDYWKNVQDEFKTKYGNDEHTATYKIAKEIKVTDQVFQILESIGFSNSYENYVSESLDKKIACYSDFRVAPYGVESLENRLKDGKKRFIARKKAEYDPKLDLFDKYVYYIELIEAQIFNKSTIKPTDITSNSIEHSIQTFSKFEIITT